jgi:hypothetical protein
MVGAEPVGPAYGHSRQNESCQKISTDLKKIFVPPLTLDLAPGFIVSVQGQCEKEGAMDGLTIGETAKQADVHIETLRYYERRGLVPRPRRSVSNYRLYTADTVRRAGSSRARRNSASP